MTQTTFADYWPDFMDLCRLKRLTNSTVIGYAKEWRNRVGPRFGSTAISEITFGEIQRWVLTLTRAQGKHSVALLRVMINSAIDDGKADRNPLDNRRVRYARAAPAVHAMWGADDVLNAMVRLNGSRIEALYLALVGGGLRVEESLGLSWDRVEPSGDLALLRIESAWTQTDGIKPTKNAYSTRTVPVGPPFSLRLVELRASSPEGSRLWDGYPALATRYWRVLFDPCMPLHGLPPVRLKDLRAIHETLMQESGVLDTVNARLHGRTNVMTGYRHYLKPQRAVSDATEQLSIYLRKAYDDALA